MRHLTWEIPAERVRSRAAQSLDDLRFTLQLFWAFLIGPFVAAPAPLVAGAKAGAPLVLIVPGFICRPAIYRRLQAAIHAAGFPCHILDLGFQVGSITEKARLLSEHLTRSGATDAIVVAHSMGGLVVADCLQQGETRIRRGWTLGAPLFGTNVIWGVYGLALLGLLSTLTSGPGPELLLLSVFLSPALSQMLPGSILLRRLTPGYDKMPRLTSVFCALDLIAFSNPLKEPGSSSRFGRESDVLFPEAGHNNLAMGDNAIRAIVAALAAGRG